MEIVCKNCNTSHYISDDKIPLETKTGKCKKCGASITVLGKNQLNGELVLEEMTKKTEFEGTRVRQFLACKGSVIIKEFKEIEVLNNKLYKVNLDLYQRTQNFPIYLQRQPPQGETIIVSTLILGIVKGEDQQNFFGVKLEYTGAYSNLINVFIDFDELPELIAAFDFIQAKADILKPQECDYTELIYATRDDAQFGFYQDSNNRDRKQTAFTRFQGQIAYLKLSEFLMLKNHLLKAQEHLISRGASIDNY